MPSYLKPFPIPNIPETTENTLIDLVDKILKNKELNKLFDCSNLEKEINKIVYELSKYMTKIFQKYRNLV